MKVPVFCNKCFELDGNVEAPKQFFMTNCKHIFCADCIADICSICKEHSEHFLICRDMPPHLAQYFEDPLKLMHQAEKVAKFQDMQTQFCLRNKMNLQPIKDPLEEREASSALGNGAFYYNKKRFVGNETIAPIETKNPSINVKDGVKGKQMPTMPLKEVKGENILCSPPYRAKVEEWFQRNAKEATRTRASHSQKSSISASASASASTSTRAATLKDFLEMDV